MSYTAFGLAMFEAFIIGLVGHTISSTNASAAIAAILAVVVGYFTIKWISTKFPELP